DFRMMMMMMSILILLCVIPYFMFGVEMAVDEGIFFVGISLYKSSQDLAFIVFSRKSDLVCYVVGILVLVIY
ncbi:hypothetical protein ACJX0J_040272, partial [Zea mays]